MMNIVRFLLFVFILSCTISMYGQGLKGIVCDDLNGYGIEKATVTLMRSSDSLLVEFQRTNMNGGFEFSRIQSGKYDVFISYPDYLGYATDIEIANNQVLKLDTVRLIKNSQMLNEVTIIDGSKIKFKGDTIQFIADSFKVGSNANVEDLLKKLSGIQVNSKGEITAFGEKVEKVFVDGEEFFGSDPTIATRNIQAKAVDKVQVFDKTSKMEEMTGIPDDEKFKAINLTLKDEYKKGYFGKATAGIGVNPIYYDESLMLQAYTSKTKFSVYGVASNTGTTGLNFDDMNKYGGGGGMSSFYGGDGMMFISYTVDDDDFSWDGRYNGEGLPKSISGGASFSTKLAKDKVKISGGYGYSDLKLNKETSDISTNFLQDKSYAQTSTEKSTNKVLTNSGKLKFEFDIDSFTNLTVNTSASVKNNENFKDVHTRQVGLDSSLITTVDRTLANNKETTSFNGEVALSRKFRKKGRFLGLNGSLNYSEGNGTSGLLSENKFYAQQIFQDLNQLKTLNNTNLSYNGSMTYSEPISDKWSAQGNIYSRQTGNLSSRITNELNDETQQYDRYIDTLSNDFNYVVSTNGGGLALNFKSEKYNFRLGTNADYATTLRENKINTTKTYNYTFRWLPSANFNYKFNRTSSLRLRYSGSTRQPTIDQIQPVRDNSDPTVLVKGNPDLLQSYSQNMNISYNMWKALSDFSMWSSANFSNTFNEIVTNTYIDESRRSITTYTNVNGGFNSSVYVSFDMRFSKNLRGGVGVSGNGSKRVSFVNNVKTDVMNYSFSPSFDFNVSIEEKLDFDISYYPNFNRSFGNLVAGAGNYFSQGIRSSLRYKISKMFEFRTDLNWDNQSAESAFSQKFNQAIWNASLEWTIDKNKNLVCQLMVKDILNQNTGYRRNVNIYSTQESRYNTIKRYGFISLIYNIKSNSGSK